MDEEKKKISLPEMVLFGLLNAGADLFDVFAIAMVATVVGVVFPLIASVVGFIVWAITEFWLIMRAGFGMRQQGSFLVGAIADLIPGLSVLPLRTVTLFVTIYLINNPKATAVMGVATGKVRAMGNASGTAGMGTAGTGVTLQSSRSGALRPPPRSIEGSVAGARPSSTRIIEPEAESQLAASIEIQ